MSSLPLSDDHIALVASHPAFGNFWLARWEAISGISLVPSCPMASDVLVIPEHWTRTKRQLIATRRTIDFTKAVICDGAGHAVEHAAVVRRLKRLAAILMTTPVTFPGGSVCQPSKPVTWVVECDSAIRAAAWIFTNTEPVNAPSQCPDGGPIFARLTPDAVERLRNTKGHSGFWKHTAPKLAALAAMGFIDDWPSFDIGAGRERRRKGGAIPNTSLKANVRWQPFADDFTARIGKASLWMTETLGPQLLDCLRTVQAVQCPFGSHTLAKAQAKAIDEWAALDSQLEMVFPIGLIIPGAVKRGSPKLFEMKTMAPPNKGSLLALLSLLQTAHVVIVALATAARESELTGLQRDCLRAVGTQDLLVGYTFKLSDEAAGERRDWPLPKIAVAALRQQQTMADLLSPGANHLWLSFGHQSDDFPDLRKFYDVLSRFGDRIMVDGKVLKQWCTDGTIHPHRFRKTVTRLAALSLVGATSIMYDILGHRDPEMTLNYILSDPDLQDEIRKIATEVNVVLSKEAIQQATENGGPAGPAVIELSQRLAARSAEAEMGVDTVAEAAEILSMNGHVTLVKPGVLCTKTIGQRGACTKNAGTPDIGNCSIACGHRLELAAAASDCRNAIEQILVEMAGTSDGGMMRAWWQSQLVAQLRRFPLIRRQYLRDERVCIALAGLDGISLATLDAEPSEHHGEQN